MDCYLGVSANLVRISEMRMRLPDNRYSHRFKSRKSHGKNRGTDDVSGVLFVLSESLILKHVRIDRPDSCADNIGPVKFIDECACRHRERLAFLGIFVESDNGCCETPRGVVG